MTQASLFRGARTPKRKMRDEIPAGCRACKGRPFVEGHDGSQRCTCARGDWLRDRDRARKAGR